MIDMPIEIKELHIKTIVDNSSDKKSAASENQPETMKKIVAQCVEQVMDILKDKEER